MKRDREQGRMGNSTARENEIRDEIVPDFTQKRRPQTTHCSGYIPKGTKLHSGGGASEFRSFGEVKSEIWLGKLPTRGNWGEKIAISGCNFLSTVIIKNIANLLFHSAILCKMSWRPILSN